MSYNSTLLQVNVSLNSPDPQGHRKRKHSSRQPSAGEQSSHRRSKTTSQCAIKFISVKANHSFMSTVLSFNFIFHVINQWPIPPAGQEWLAAASAAGSRAPSGCKHRTRGFLWTHPRCRSAVSTEGSESHSRRQYGNNSQAFWVKSNFTLAKTFIVYPRNCTLGSSAAYVASILVLCWAYRDDPSKANHSAESIKKKGTFKHFMEQWRQVLLTLTRVL